ncbi:hypothetical protein BU14_0187s0006 [Porphyra umbilicalis]|uniref:Uncharacterized protein n=1 Tax=Porphyra umbilicalis TaxID=2786 RepID=A0A1X6P6R0_PORUM|nr:hypothetical protein BU14_0187s0006 [Porphyra umbilicalis]|eukprot:OSX76527.1 hypothetical protein BU14_0187s0006 [Porphyra umbilicalis]
MHLTQSLAARPVPHAAGARTRCTTADGGCEDEETAQDGLRFKASCFLAHADAHTMRSHDPFRNLAVHERQLLIGCPFAQIADSTFATVPHEKRKGATRRSETCHDYNSLWQRRPSTPRASARHACQNARVSAGKKTPCEGGVRPTANTFKDSVHPLRQSTFAIRGSSSPSGRAPSPPPSTFTTPPWRPRLLSLRAPMLRVLKPTTPHDRPNTTDPDTRSAAKDCTWKRSRERVHNHSRPITNVRSMVDAKRFDFSGTCVTRPASVMTASPRRKTTAPRNASRPYEGDDVERVDLAERHHVSGGANVPNRVDALAAAEVTDLADFGQRRRAAGGCPRRPPQRRNLRHACVAGAPPGRAERRGHVKGAIVLVHRKLVEHRPANDAAAAVRRALRPIVDVKLVDGRVESRAVIVGRRRRLGRGSPPAVPGADENGNGPHHLPVVGCGHIHRADARVDGVAARKDGRTRPERRRRRVRVKRQRHDGEDVVARKRRRPVRAGARRHVASGDPPAGIPRRLGAEAREPILERGGPDEGLVDLLGLRFRQTNDVAAGAGAVAGRPKRQVPPRWRGRGEDEARDPPHGAGADVPPLQAGGREELGRPPVARVDDPHDRQLPARRPRLACRDGPRRELHHVRADRGARAVGNDHPRRRHIRLPRRRRGWRGREHPPPPPDNQQPPARAEEHLCRRQAASEGQDARLDAVPPPRRSRHHPQRRVDERIHRRAVRLDDIRFGHALDLGVGVGKVDARLPAATAAVIRRFDDGGTGGSARKAAEDAAGQPPGAAPKPVRADAGDRLAADIVEEGRAGGEGREAPAVGGGGGATAVAGVAARAAAATAAAAMAAAAAATVRDGDADGGGLEGGGHQWGTLPAGHPGGAASPSTRPPSDDGGRRARRRTALFTATPPGTEPPHRRCGGGRPAGRPRRVGRRRPVSAAHSAPAGGGPPRRRQARAAAGRAAPAVRDGAVGRSRRRTLCPCAGGGQTVPSVRDARARRLVGRQQKDGSDADTTRATLGGAARESVTPRSRTVRGLQVVELRFQ